MARAIGRLSTAWALGLALGTALAFLGAARWRGEAPAAAIVGGTVWVFLLALIVALPLVAGRTKRRSGGTGSRAPGALRDRSPMELTAALWLCTLPFIALLLGPWLGFRAVLLVALAWAAVMATVCWTLCATRGARLHTSHNQGGPR